MLTKYPLSIRTALLLTVNMVLLVALVLWLSIDYHRGLVQRLHEKQVSLDEEAALMLPAVSALHDQDIATVQRYIDHACAYMQETVSPGHHIVVRRGQMILQAQTHHRASEAMADAVQKAGNVRDRTGMVGGRVILVGTQKSDDGNIQVYVSEFTTNVQRAAQTKLIARSVEMGILGFLLTAIINLILLRLVTRPVTLLVTTVRQIADGHLGTTPPALNTLEFDFLSNEIKKMSEKLALADQNRRFQMEKARKIQHHLLPVSEQLNGIGIHHIHMPAEDVGGDFFDVLSHDERIAICIGDVTGHGVPAAMGAGMLKILFEQSMVDWSDPAQALIRINRRFGQVTLDGDFATMFMGILNRFSGQLVYASAGHETGYLITPNGQFSELKTTGLLLGVDPDATCDVITTMVQPGDRIVLLTDGLIEAMSPSGQALGRDRVQKTLMATYGLPVAQQAHALVDLVQTHQDTDHQQDDITIVMVDV